MQKTVSKKPVIAVDIDDVLAANAEGFVKFSNERWGTNLAVDDYQEHWSDMWQVDHAEAERRAVEFHASGVLRAYRSYSEAVDVLRALKKKYTLAVVTSRRRSVESETLAWLEFSFGDIFTDVHFAGIYDIPIADGSYARTKKEVFAAISAEFVIDDQLKHCQAASEVGSQAILFGNYPWNQKNILPENVTRCKDWQAVLEYFNGRR